jgi:hypothetical protein
MKEKEKEKEKSDGLISYNWMELNGTETLTISLLEVDPWYPGDLKGISFRLFIYFS